MRYNGRIRELVSHDDSRLRKPAHKVKKEELRDPLFRQLLADMAMTMLAKNGIGLAAPQVGVQKQVFVLRTVPVISVVINPIVTPDTESEVIEEDEGCLSLPGQQIGIKRHSRVTIRGWEPGGKTMTFKLEGLLARVVQHETDHLQGLLIDQLHARHASSLFLAGYTQASH